MTREQYSDQIAKVSKDVGVDQKLFTAILEVESNWDANAIRYEPVFPYAAKPEFFSKILNITEETERMLQKFSWGLGQVMGATARSLGMSAPLQSLNDPNTGIFWSAVYLKHVCSRYAKIEDQAAAYNAGSATFRDYKNYVNQDYVDKVNKALAKG